jgi:hypothetical protein
MKKTFLKRLAFLALFATPSVIAVMPAGGCSKGKNLCDLICDCTKCSDRGFDDCVDQINGGVATAKAYECEVELNAVYDCYTQEFDCDDRDNTIDHPCSAQFLPGSAGCTNGNPDCEDEERDLGECIADNSDLNGNAGPGPAPAPGPGPGGGGGAMCCDCTCVDTMTCPVATVADVFGDCTQSCDQQYCMVCGGVADAVSTGC